MKTFKPQNYNSLCPYLVVENANRLAELLKKIFDAKEMRRFEDQGRIKHMEIQIDDSILMISDSIPAYPAQKAMFFVYVPDVHATFRKALEHGCEKMEEPSQSDDELDVRGAFMDFCGNYWGIGTQIEP